MTVDTMATADLAAAIAVQENVALDWEIVVGDFQREADTPIERMTDANAQLRRHADRLYRLQSVLRDRLGNGVIIQRRDRDGVQ